MDRLLLTGEDNPANENLLDDNLYEDNPREDNVESIFGAGSGEYLCRAVVKYRFEANEEYKDQMSVEANEQLLVRVIFR